jgi:hypothetical protein
MRTHTKVTSNSRQVYSSTRTLGVQEQSGGGGGVRADGVACGVRADGVACGGDASTLDIQ